MRCRANHEHAGGMLRREILQVGFLGAFGLLLDHAVAAPAPAEAAGSAKAVIVIWMPGGPPQMHFWDPKPDSPAQCRGSARPLKTSAPGIEIGHRLPLIAQQAHRFALVRSITLNSEDQNHIQADQMLLSGINKLPPNFNIFLSRDEWPSMGSVISYKKPNTGGLPTAIHVPYRVRFTNAAVAGESAGWLGSRHDPWITQGDPNLPDYHVPDLLPMPGFTVDRLSQRRQLLGQVDGFRRDLEADLGAKQLTDAQQRAFALTTSAGVVRAFDLKQEPDPLRERYGRHTWGQSMLLARRLVQHGVKFVQVNLGDHVNYWDYHSKEDALMDQHCPPFDRAFSALLEDLAQQGLLDETLVVCLSEMGRNPVLGKLPPGVPASQAAPDGRNHWHWCWTGVLAGGGVRGGTVVGESDEWAGQVKSDPVYPADLSATVFHCMGIDPHSEVRDMLDRPMPLSEGTVIRKLFTG
jgi:uncharacterized protein (DUF1501 family)